MPLLRDCLDATLPSAPRIFIDQSQPTGVHWPTHIQTALLESKLMVAVWTPPFFRSDWCLAEWKSMLEREDLLAGQGIKPARGLIYPVVYSDGKHFDAKAKERQYQTNLSSFTYPYECFKESGAYLQFYDAVMSIAQEIEDHLGQVPPWQPNWPTIVPPPSPDVLISLPRI
jgi:hypothetical protein